jgi:hypothetical protein
VCIVYENGREAITTLGKKTRVFTVSCGDAVFCQGRVVVTSDAYRRELNELLDTADSLVGCSGPIHGRDKTACCSSRRPFHRAQAHLGSWRSSSLATSRRACAVDYRPGPESADPIFLAAATCLLPRWRWSAFVTPQTLLAWQRRLVARRRPHRSAGKNPPLRYQRIVAEPGLPRAYLSRRRACAKSSPLRARASPGVSWSHFGCFEHSSEGAPLPLELGTEFDDVPRSVEERRQSFSSRRPSTTRLRSLKQMSNGRSVSAPTSLEAPHAGYRAK